MFEVLQKIRQDIIKRHAYDKYRKRGTAHGKHLKDYYSAKRWWIILGLRDIIKENLSIIVAITSIITTIVLIAQMIISSSNFLSLNRPFVEVEIMGVFPNPEGRGEDTYQVWCELSYRIKNYGHVPAYNVRIPPDGLKVKSKERGEFTEKDIPNLKDFKISWLAPDDTRRFRRAIIYTDSKENVEKYKRGIMPLEIIFRIDYDGPKCLFYQGHYWYSCEAQYVKGNIIVVNSHGL